jgi:hypothetical protein
VAAVITSLNQAMAIGCNEQNRNERSYYSPEKIDHVHAPKRQSKVFFAQHCRVGSHERRRARVIQRRRPLADAFDDQAMTSSTNCGAACSLPSKTIESITQIGLLFA